MVTKTFAARDEVAAAPIATRKLASSHPPPADKSEKIETIATRPIETPAESHPPPSRSAARVALLAVALAGALGTAWWLRADHTTPRSTATSTVPATATAAVTPTATVAATATVTATATATTAAPSTSSDARLLAHLALFGDPGTRVFIDGTPRGACPISDVAVEPGDHDVRFVFAPTNESSGTRVSPKPSEHLKLRADFTGATPTVRVQH
jgi:hypothetical protein